METKENGVDINKIIVELVENNVNRIFSSAKELFKDKYDKVKIKYSFAFKNYLIKASNKYSRIKTLLYRTEPKYLYDFFECNTLVYRNTKIIAEDVNNILDISKFIIIQGTGGMGKTTLMKHFFLNELIKDNLIPIFIELKDLNDNKTSIFECLYNSLCKLGFNLEEKYFEYALKSGCFLILLDGFDEIISKKHNQILKDIDKLCDKYSDNYYVISSRPNDVFISLNRFTILETLEFTKEQAINLINRIEYDKDIKQRFIEQLDKKLYDQHKSFASNPLLLNIMLLTFDNYAEIPEKLHIFYSNAFETLYSKHDATKAGYRREMLSKLSYDNFKIIFSKFCFRTYLKNKIEFTLEDIYEYFKKIKNNVDVNFEVMDYIKDLIYSVCVIYKDGINYKFTHRSFQEFFTAVYLKELTDEQQKKACYYLITHNNNILRQDQVLWMLYDMSQDRLEKNVVMPLLIELEETMDKTSDKYFEYFKSLVEGIVFKVENEEISLWHRTSCSDKKKEFINNFVRRIQKSRRPHKNKCKFEIKILNKMIEQGIIELSFDCDEIIKDNELYEYVTESWIGEYVKDASKLLDTLYTRQKEVIKELDELLDIE